MKKLISLFVKYPFYGKAFILFFTLFGFLTMGLMNKSFLPVVESKIIVISIAYQGATPKEMEEGVVTLIENSLRGLPGIKEHSSVSRENFASVNVVIENNYDVDNVLYDIKNGIDGISNFPVGAERPVVAKMQTTTPAMFITLKAKHKDQLKLNEESQKIEDDLRMCPEISNITVFGLPKRMEMSIEINEDALEKYGITLEQVKNMVISNNLDLYGGVIQNANEQIQINLRNRSLDESQIENIVILASENGSLVKIKDIGNVIKRFEDTAGSSFINGDQNIMMMISNLKEENLQITTEYITDYMEKYNATHTETQLSSLMNFMDLLNGQLSILYGNGIMGVCLVILCLSLFLSFRTSLWVAWGLPMSFLGMFVIAQMLGVSLNMISLFGMILIIGILVDDGIVVSENIYSYYEKGYSPKVAAIKGTMEVMPAIFISVLTTIIAFAPILFIQGSMEMMYEMAIVVILCLIFSFIESVLVLPSHLAHKKVLEPASKNNLYGKTRSLFDRIIKYLCYDLYRPFVKWTLRHKSIVFAATTAMFILTAGLLGGGRIGFTFVPQMNENFFTVDIAMKPGTPKEITLDLLNYVTNKIRIADSALMKKYGESSFIQSTSQVTGAAFNENEYGEHCGMIYVMLKSLDETSIGSEEIKKTIAEQIGELPTAYKYAVGASSRFGAPVSISLFGSNDKDLANASELLKSELQNVSSLYNVMDNNQIGSQEVRLELRPEAYALGFTSNMIMSQVRDGFYGSLAQRVQDGRNEVWFYVRYPRSSRENTYDLENLKIRNENGEYPLYQLCNFHLDRSATKINHFDGRKEIRVEANMIDPNESVTPILARITEDILPEITSIYPDITFMHQGQVKDAAESVAVIQLFFGIAFILITLILMVYFRSFMQGFLVLSIIPLSFIAAIWGHWIENIPVSMMSVWGMIALSGTIINNAVVFLSRYNDCLKNGLSVDDAIIETGSSRFRPIILTSITTTLGLFPLIKETSSDATMIIPMAVSLGYGILLGTIFILAVLPSMIKAANIAAISIAKLKGEKNITPESVEVAVRDKQVDDMVNEESN